MGKQTPQKGVSTAKSVPTAVSSPDSLPPTKRATRVIHHPSRLTPLIVALLVTALRGIALADPQPGNVTGKVSGVTLYRGQALITRTLLFTAVKGSQEVVVTDLPQHIVEGSLFAEALAGLEVRAVRLRQVAVGEEPREDIRTFDLALAELADKLQLNQKNQELAAKKAAYLDGLEGFVAPTAKNDLAKGVLDAVALEKVTLFSFAERQKIAEEQIVFLKEQRLLTEQATLLQHKKAELTSGTQRTVKEAVLFLETNAAGPATVRLNYLVSNCGWSATYTCRAAQDRQTVDLEYNGLIQQMTGENWEEVSLTLSTASPALSAAGPGLAPFYVSLTRPTPNPEGASAASGSKLDAGAFRDIKLRQQSANNAFSNSQNFDDNLGFNWDVICAADDSQTLELTNSKDILATMRRDAGESGGPSISYQLPGSVSLASRSDQQMVRIMKHSLPSAFYHVATPVLTSYVYREAELKNTSPDDLLAGPITVSLDGRFVGRGDIPTVARGETFVVGFGADPQLRARREFIDKKENVQGGNRELSFKYRVAIENYKDQAAAVRIFDRLPYADRGSDVRVTLSELKLPLSTDPAYLRSERSKGLLRFDVDVAANATAEKALVIEYSFTVDFDRALQISPVGARPEGKREFEQMQRGRLKK